MKSTCHAKEKGVRGVDVSKFSDLLAQNYLEMLKICEEESRTGERGGAGSKQHSTKLPSPYKGSVCLWFHVWIAMDV